MSEKILEEFNAWWDETYFSDDDKREKYRNSNVADIAFNAWQSAQNSAEAQAVAKINVTERKIEWLVPEYAVRWETASCGVYPDILLYTAPQAALRTHENGRQESEAGAVAEVMGTETDMYIGVTNLNNWSRLPAGTKLYLAPPSAPAIEAAAIMRAEECVISTFNEFQFKDSDTQLCVKAALGDVRVKLRALIPQDGRTALEECRREARKEALLEAARMCDVIASSAGTNPIHCAYELRRMAEGEK